MTNLKRTTLLAFTLFFLFVFVAYAAQEQPPEQDLINGIVAAIAAVAALVSSALVNLIKQIPYLGDEDKDKLATAVTQIVAVVVSVATGYLLALLAQGLGLIADAGLKTMVISILTAIFAEVRYRLVKLAPR